MRPVRTLTGTTQTGTIKITWARSKSMKRLQETCETWDRHECLHEACRKSIFLLWSASLCLFDVKCSTANKKEYSWKRGKKREFYLSDIVLRNSEYDLTRPPSKSKPLPLMLPYSILDASSVSMKYSTIASLRIQQLWFSLKFFQLSAIVEWSNNTLAHAQNNDLRPFSNQFVFTCIVPRSNFRLVRVIRVVSATGMSETDMRWFFRPASCKQKQAALKSCGSDFSCNQGLSRKLKSIREVNASGALFC